MHTFMVIGMEHEKRMELKKIGIWISGVIMLIATIISAVGGR